MKLKCAVVEDIYVLYKEGELSEEVKTAVEKHVKECPQCSRVYKYGEGFKNILGESEKLEPSRTTDEKIMFNLKVKRLKIAVLFVLSLFLITSLQSYYNSRQHLRSDLSSAEHAMWQLKLGIDNVKSEVFELYSVGDTLYFLTDRGNIITRNLNIREKKALNENPLLFIHPGMNNLLDMLNTRYLSESWSHKDEEVLIQLLEYVENAVLILTAERESFNNLDRNKLQIFTHSVNVDKLVEIFNNINLLIQTYYNYNMLPDEIALASEEELKDRLNSLFGDSEVTFLTQSQHSKTLGIVDFELKTEDDVRYYGRLDAYTGDILSFRMVNAKTEGELLSRETVENVMDDFLNNLHRNRFQYEIEYLGINHNFTSNVNIKLYTYTVIPVLNGLKVDYPIDITMDARTGRVHSFETHRGPVPDFNITDVNFDTLITKEQAVKEIEFPETVPIPKFQETILIQSLHSGNIEPVHVYININRNYYYINAITGKREYH